MKLMHDKETVRELFGIRRQVGIENWEEGNDRINKIKESR